MDLDSTLRMTNLSETEDVKAHTNVKVVLKTVSDSVMKCRLQVAEQGVSDHKERCNVFP